MGHDCGVASPTTFSYNVAHSVQGNLDGTGAFVYPDKASPKQTTCFEAANFAAYKCSEAGIFSSFNTKGGIFRDMTMIDNGGGSGIYVSQGEGAEYGEMLT